MEDKKKYFYDFLDRCIPLLTREGVEKLEKSSVAIAGCGGVGGALAVTLARMGVGNFKLADPGLFDPPDINRQWAANIPNLGKNKTDAYEEMLLGINPEINIKKYPEGITGSNVRDFLEGADLLIDCLDIAVSPKLRGELFKQARKNNIYSISSPIIGFGTVFCCSSPAGMPMDKLVNMVDKGGSLAKLPRGLWNIFMPQHLDIIESRLSTHKVPSVPISPMISASISATESILILLGDIVPGARKPVCLPKIIVTDFFRLSYHVVDINNL